MSSNLSMSSSTHCSRSFVKPRRRSRGSRITRSGFGRLLVSHIRQSERGHGGRATKALLALALCAAFAFLYPTTASTRTASAAVTLIAKPLSLDGMAREIVYLVNLERAQHALPPLRVNTRLVADARLQAAQIAETGVLDHVILSGPYPTPRVRAEAAGYAWNALGENLALGFADAPSAVAAWMQSPGHRANILGGGYSAKGGALFPRVPGRLVFLPTLLATQKKRFFPRGSSHPHPF